jgi:hypothetical protein
MAQMQFTNYQDDILSFDLRQAMLGILNPGRYCGYDTISPVSEGGGVISITIRHTATGIRKASKANPPVLGLQHGVVVTPQGMIIHDDNAAIPITIDDGSGNGGLTRYDVIYMSHIYLDGVPGDNPATYHIVKGTPGSGTPAVPFPAYQVPLILVTIPDGVTTWTGLTFTPVPCPELGDLDMNSILNTVIGNRLYTEENYIYDEQSITDSLNNLDIQLKDEHDAILEVAGRGIDSPFWGALSDIVSNNTSTLAHGLMPKLPGAQASQHFFNSAGQWVNPGTDWIWLNATQAQVDTGLIGGLSYNANGYLNLAAMLGDTGITEVLVTMYWYRNGGTLSSAWGSATLSADSNIRDALSLQMLCPPAALNLSGGFYVQNIQGIVRVINNQIYLAYHNISGTVSQWNAPDLYNTFGIKILAYKKSPVVLV